MLDDAERWIVPWNLQCRYESLVNSIKQLTLLAAANVPGAPRCALVPSVLIVVRVSWRASWVCDLESSPRVHVQVALRQPEPDADPRSLCAPSTSLHAACEKDVAVPPRP